VTPVLAAKIEHWPIGRLVPYARNARTHSPAQVEQIAKSITEFGFVNPILVDGEAGGILAGHGRLQAAQLLMLALVPVIVLGHLTEAQRRAYIVADNKHAENAGWDMALLTDELEMLAGVFSLDTLGFDQKEFESMIARTLPPDEFAEYSEEDIETQHTCPKCGYRWSGGE
jgi:ParB-like chromosome segregation protein Spo0J